MIYPTPTQVLLTTILQPLILQLSGSLALAARRIATFLQRDPTPEKTMAFARELSHLLREVGRCIVAWTLHQREPADDAQAPSRVLFEDRLSRRRAKSRILVATLFGTIELWRRLYEPLERGHRSMHPLQLRLGIEAGLATPALADRTGRWAADHTQRQVLEMLKGDHHVQWSCHALRKLLASLQAGMAPYREVCQVDQVVGWIKQAQAAKGRFRPTLAVGRDGIFVPLRGGVFQEGVAATVSVFDRNAKRMGTIYLGRRPQSGQGRLTTQLTALLESV